MKLLGLTPDRSPQHQCWVAIWRTPRGNFIHDRLPLFVEDVDLETARNFARENIPSWNH